MVADVLSESDDGVSSSYGTGFVVSESGHILTNHHVVEECSEITFQIRGSETREVALLSTNAPSDLALLKIESFDGDPAGFLSSSIARMGEELVVYGFPLAGDLSAQGNFTDGIVSAMSGLNDDLTKFQMTAPIQPGNSGGPVLSLSGQIIGVVVETANQEFFREQRDTDTQNINFAIHGAIAMRFLETNNVQYEVGPTTRGTLTLSELASRTQEFTGIVRCIN
jgi:S1-C subfamily serine protease